MSDEITHDDVELIHEDSRTKSEVRTQEIEDSENTVLDSILDSDDSVETISTALGAHKGVYQGQEPPEEEAQPEDSEPTGQPESEEAEESEEQQKALRALARDGVPQGIIDQMADENPQGLIEWGLARAKNQADVDGYGNRLAELENQTSKSDDPDADSDDEVASDGDGVDTQEGEPAPSIPEHLRGVVNLDVAVAELEEEFGQDVAKSFKSYGEHIVNGLTHQLAERDNMLSFLMERVRNSEIVGARDKLSERFPQLADDQVFTSVMQQMSEFANNNPDLAQSPNGTERVMSKVAESLLSREKLAVFERNERNKKRSAGQPSVASNRIRKPSQALSADAREDAALDALLDGGDAAAARKAYGQW